MNQKKYFPINTKTATPDKKMQINLLHYLNEIDNRRNLNWRTTFPWLEKYVLQ
jgi:hypothetical protein